MSSETVRLTVDQAVCIGGGQCEMLEPDTFLLDDDTAISSVIGSGELPRDSAESVVDRCPSGAISMQEAEPIGEAG